MIGNAIGAAIGATTAPTTGIIALLDGVSATLTATLENPASEIAASPALEGVTAVMSESATTTGTVITFRNRRASAITSAVTQNNSITSSLTRNTSPTNEIAENDNITTTLTRNTAITA